MDLSKTVFGKATLREESAGSIVTPQKNSAEVEAEHRVGRELYKKVSIHSVVSIYLPPSSSPLSPILVISSSFPPSPLIPPPFSSASFHPHLIQSHNDWEVGEMMDRDYDWSKFTRESLYGVPTPHDNSGSQVKSSLHWMPQRSALNW